MIALLKCIQFQYLTFFYPDIMHIVHTLMLQHQVNIKLLPYIIIIV